MGIVVQKYGGSSLSDADGDQAGGPPDRPGQEAGPRRRGRGLGDGRQHRRAARPRQRRQPAAAGPRARHAAHRRRADLDGAGRDGDLRPRLHRALLHRLAGRGDHRLGPRPGQDHRHHARPDHQGPRRRPHRDRGRLPGGQPGHQGDHHPRPRRHRHHRGRARRRARRRGVRDLHRRRRRLHRRPPAGADRPPARPRLHRGDAGDGGVRREDPAPALRGVRPPLRHPGPRPVLLLPEGRHLDPARPPGGSRPHGAGDHRRHRPRPQRGQDHRRRRPRQGR